jgi:hypothetical protein
MRRAEPDDPITRPSLTTDDRLDAVSGATRRLGGVLFVSVGGATRPVERLSGSGPLLWELFDEGLTIGEATARLARVAEQDPNEVEEHVLRFAKALVDAGLRARRT